MKISYITSHGTAEWVKFDSQDGEVISLVIDKAADGAVTLGNKTFTLTKGAANIPTRSLADGDYAPIFETDEGVFAGERFHKSGQTVIPKSADEAFIRRLLTRFAVLEKSSRKLEERVSRLEERCSGHNIFNF